MVKKQYIGSSEVLDLARDIDSGKKTVYRIQCVMGSSQGY